MKDLFGTFVYQIHESRKGKLVVCKNLCTTTKLFLMKFKCHHQRCVTVLMKFSLAPCDDVVTGKFVDILLSGV